MTFTYKLARRLARLKGWTAIVATVVAATIFGCELPVRTTDTGSTIAQLLVSPKNVSLQPNQAQDFLAVGFTATGDSADASVTWSASGGSVTSSSAGKRHYGLYQNATCGAFTVVATSNPGALSDTAVVTVSGCTVPVASVTVTPASATVRTGQGVQLTATPKDANGTPLAGRVVTWASSNTALAVVDVNGNVTGMSPGSATITATSEGQRGTAAITVTNIPVASVTVNPSPASVQQGSTVQLTATPKDANGTPLTGRVVTWASNNTTVATVNGSGLVTGRAAGSATITATSEGRSGTSSITVTPVPVASVTVTPASGSVAVGSTLQLTATPKDANGNPLTGRTITWQSSDATVASVNGSGLVMGVAAGGPVTITATSEGQSGTSAITVTPPSASVVLVGAGDIADCDAEPTAALLDNIPGTVFTAGDNAYPDGSASDYASCYDPSWGRHKARTRPAPGNHDYQTSGATGYYNYFGALAGPAGRGYYSYDLGAWHIVSLNSNVSMSAGSAQETWLRADLTASTKGCTIAYWHHPRFSSGSSHGSSTQSAGVWQALYDAGAEIVISGHDHEYERFAPQTPSAAADPARGIREFIVGTGGAGLYSFATPLPNSEVRDDASFGVLKLTLSDGSYTWEFIPIAGDSFTDSGSGTCH